MLATAEEAGIQPLAADTDSGFLRCSEEDGQEFAEHMVPVADKWVEGRGGEPGLIRLELEKVYDRIFWTAKKRYVGKLRGSGKLDVKGLEYVRTDGCAYMRRFQKAVIDYIMDTEVPTSEGARETVLFYRENLFEMVVDKEELVLTQSVGKPLDEYKVEPVHVRIARKMLEDGREVFEGMKVPYVIVGKEQGTGKGKRLSAVHVDDFDGAYDPVVYWRQKVYPPIRSILEAVWPGEDWKGLLKRRGDAKAKG
jgi:DNA polymerase elongation subunit (family B)